MQTRYIIGLLMGEMPIARSSCLMKLIKGTEAGTESPDIPEKLEERLHTYSH